MGRCESEYILTRDSKTRLEDSKTRLKDSRTRLENTTRPLENATRKYDDSKLSLKNLKTRFTSSHHQLVEPSNHRTIEVTPTSPPTIEVKQISNQSLPIIEPRIPSGRGCRWSGGATHGQRRLHKDQEGYTWTEEATQRRQRQQAKGLYMGGRGCR